MAFKQESAETIALQALGWIAGDEELLGSFIGASGLTGEDMRSRAGEPEFLASVLDFILMDDAWVQGFCDSVGIPYDWPMAARACLPGMAPHWT